MTKFIIKGRVKYQGKLYNSGEVVEVAKEHVEEFKKHGWELANKKEDEGQGQKDGQVNLTVNSKKDDIIAELTKRGIEFDPECTKAELIALLA